jgi:hypothetical protein
VNTALAAEPSLSAVSIDVTTKDGSVVLEGPAPDWLPKPQSPRRSLQRRRPSRSPLCRRSRRPSKREQQ